MKLGRKSSCFAISMLLALGLSRLASADQDPLAWVPKGPFDYALDPNHFIAMRDGTRLAIDLYIPKGAPQQKYPVVLIRTPYGDFADSFHQRGVKFFASHGYIVAVQEKRGKYRSEGVYTASGGDANDGYDTIDWLSKQSWSNGRVGTYGCSYLGDVQIFLAQTKHPALKAMIPQASGSSVGSANKLYIQFASREGGALYWAGIVGFFAQWGHKVVPKLPTTLDRDVYTADYAPFNHVIPSTPIDYRRAWNHLPEKDALSDQGILPTDFEDTITKPVTDAYWNKFPYMTDSYTSDVPALFVNSWYDFAPDTTLFQFNWFRTHSVSEQTRQNQYFIMGPGTHCSMDREATSNYVVGTREVGDARFDYWQAYLTWFDYWLKSAPEARKTIDSWPHLRYYEMGTNRWTHAEQWPLTTAHDQKLLLVSGGHANSVFGDGALILPSGSEQRNAQSKDSFSYDPSLPVPTIGGAICCTGSSDPSMQAGGQDQRPVEARNDVLVYTTETLKDGINVTGPIATNLYVSSTAVDTDFTAKLVDVYPDGRAFNVVEKILRARNREGMDKEVWMRQGKVYRLHIPMGVTSNYFGPGHRIRLEVSSSNFPLFDRNLNVGGKNEEATTWVVAKNDVYHSQQYPSELVLPVAPR